MTDARKKKDATPSKESFNDLVQEISAVVTKLEDPDITLETAVESFETGMRLIGTAQTKLSQSEQTVNNILKTALDAAEEKDEESQ